MSGTKQQPVSSGWFLPEKIPENIMIYTNITEGRETSVRVLQARDMVSVDLLFPCRN
jgi:hypothetical protein